MPRLPLPPITPFLYSEEMHGLIEEKKLRRENLNIFVLSAEYFGIKNFNSELSFFFKLLSKNINDSKIPSRFQLAIENQGHWFSVDCYIKNNQLYLLVLDAAVNDSSAEIIKKAALDLNPIILAYRGIQIQYDFKHCSFFTLDHLFHLSNRDQHWNDLLNLNLPARENIIYFDHNSSPSSLAFIFKNMQSFKGLDKLPDSLKNSFINENQTLDQRIMKNSRSRIFLGVENKMNAGIILKEKKYMERGANFFKPANYRKIVSSRQGFEIIGGEVGEIIKEIITHKGKNYLKPFIKENKALIKDNIRDMFDIAIGYDLGNFLALLIENKLLNKDHSIPTSEIAIASKPLNFTEAQFVKDNLMGNTQEYGTIGCNFKAKSGAEFTFFYDKDNATISSSNWKQNKGKDDRFDCKSESNDVNDCPFSFIKNN